jgi:hypothetical protein
MTMLSLMMPVVWVEGARVAPDLMQIEHGR